ncbi:MAG: DUF4339 domain-containing protein [Prevotellaceae bacterium]|nr:DUF4339 domain-containing protein [Prevotellaceae bacterium]
MEYFLLENGQQTGPFSLEQLAQKNITAESLLWADGMKDWTPAWQIDELKPILIAKQSAQQTSQQQTADPQGAPSGPQGQQPRQQASAGTDQPSGTDTLQSSGQGSNKPPRWKKPLIIILSVLAAILIILAITNPSEEVHKQAIKTEVSSALNKLSQGQEVNSDEQDLLSMGMNMITRMFAGPIIDTVLDSAVQYHNDIFFSKCTVFFNGEEHTVSFGILGKVKTMNDDDIIRAIEGEKDLNAASTDDDSQMDTNSDTNDGNNADADDPNADADQAAQNIANQTEKKMNQLADSVSRRVQQQVERKVNQKLQQLADSSTIDRFINKILELI